MRLGLTFVWRAGTAALSAVLLCGVAAAQAEKSTGAQEHDGGALSNGGWFPFLVIFCSLGGAVGVAKTLEKKGGLMRHGHGESSGDYDVISAEGSS